MQKQVEHYKLEIIENGPADGRKDKLACLLARQNNHVWLAAFGSLMPLQHQVCLQEASRASTRRCSPGPDVASLRVQECRGEVSPSLSNAAGAGAGKELKGLRYCFWGVRLCKGASGAEFSGSRLGVGSDTCIPRPYCSCILRGDLGCGLLQVEHIS